MPLFPPKSGKYISHVIPGGQKASPKLGNSRLSKLYRQSLLLHQSATPNTSPLVLLHLFKQLFLCLNMIYYWPALDTSGGSHFYDLHAYKLIFLINLFICLVSIIRPAKRTPEELGRGVGVGMWNLPLPRQSSDILPWEFNGKFEDFWIITIGNKRETQS